jgi:hypothetical protein
MDCPIAEEESATQKIKASVWIVLGIMVMLIYVKKGSTLFISLWGFVAVIYRFRCNVVYLTQRWVPGQLRFLGF